MEDSTLIARVKAGDRGAFNELYGIYWASLVNYAGLFVGDDGAEDVVQDVFVRVWLHRDNLRDDGTLQGYLLPLGLPRFAQRPQEGRPTPRPTGRGWRSRSNRAVTPITIPMTAR